MTTPYRENQAAIERQETLAKARRILDTLVSMRRVIERQSYMVQMKRDDLVEVLKSVEHLAQALLDSANG